MLRPGARLDLAVGEPLLLHWDRLTGKETSDSFIIKGLKPLVSTETPTMIFATPTKPISELEGGGMHLLGRNKVPDFQQMFQKPDGLPVHLKRGVPDRLLYRTTMALTIGGTIYCLIALFLAAQPKKHN
ncbi:cytochrome c oxidase subunit 7A-related protein, mitochondrial isoform X2 [Chiloscyllium plagiosum]|uniref:cytochrome c oxidase subunit 7A-related protein, mitochondrial isoform X2 n=1 Tax=Chiloscyllium plagiosum TaxID=36176 RepID=UPI001CB84D24|nr:cytochrome c oxidase subunit 7A-related protein, mitochondrial isoform X2 [Chiloscyllium plagiosum]